MPLSPTTGTGTKAGLEPSLFRVALVPRRSEKPADHPGSAPKAQGNDTLLCSTCRAVITSEQQAIHINHRHDHTVFNPAGIVFELRCFRQAPGAIANGEPTAEFSWFPGFRWQIALCNNCQSHLGWLFTNGHAFYALIRSKLI